MTFKRVSDELNYNITVYNILENIFTEFFYEDKSSTIRFNYNPRQSIKINSFL